MMIRKEKGLLFWLLIIVAGVFVAGLLGQGILQLACRPFLVKLVQQETAQMNVLDKLADLTYDLEYGRVPLDDKDAFLDELDDCSLMLGSRNETDSFFETMRLNQLDLNIETISYDYGFVDMLISDLEDTFDLACMVEDASSEAFQNKLLMVRELCNIGFYSGYRMLSHFPKRLIPELPEWRNRPDDCVPGLTDSDYILLSNACWDIFNGISDEDELDIWLKITDKAGQLRLQSKDQR